MYTVVWLRANFPAHHGPTTITFINVHHWLGGERFTEHLGDQVEDGNIKLA